MMYPTGSTYWTKLKEFVDYEPVASIDPVTRGILASIGIIKGHPFKPTGKQQELLTKAVETAPRMILAMRRSMSWMRHCFPDLPLNSKCSLEPLTATCRLFCCARCASRPEIGCSRQDDCCARRLAIERGFLP